MTGSSLIVPEEPKDQLPAGTNETAATAVAASAKALIEARFTVAMHRPRSWNETRLKLLDACKRPRFAAGARYSKPVGGKQIVGPSVRFAEEAMRAAGNIVSDMIVRYDDADKRILAVVVTDLEANIAYSMDVTIQKVVERSRVKSGQTVVGQRTNTSGNVVYLVEATEDELLVKQAALVSKAHRQGVLRLLPSDILEEAMEKVVETLRDEDAKDPQAAMKRIESAFWDVGVTPVQLAQYLGKPLTAINQAELTLLRTLHAAIKEGEATWQEVMDTKPASKAEVGERKDLATATEQLGEKLRKKKAERAALAAQQVGIPPAPTEGVAVNQSASEDGIEEDDLAFDQRLAEEENQ